MARDEWFRQTTWTNANRDAFFARLARCRGEVHKAQYLRIQAGHLSGSSDPHMVRAALELLELLFSQYPVRTELASAHAQAARCHEQLGNLDQAVRHFQLTLEIEAAFPNARTGTTIEFPWFIVIHRLESLYEEASRVLDSDTDPTRLVFPIEIFKTEAARAFLLEARKDFFKASKHALAAIDAASRTESGFRHHKKLGLVSSKYESVIERLRVLAAL